MFRPYLCIGLRMTTPSAEAITPGQRVRLARENLCLAMALFVASHRGLISVAFFPSGAELHMPDGVTIDAGVPLDLIDQQSLLRCAGNQIRSAFTLSALQTHREMERAYGAGPLDETNSDLRTVRAVIFLIARSVDQNLLAPTWDVPADYRQAFAGPEMRFAVDPGQWHGQEIRWEHFGGLSRYLDLTLFASYCLDGAPATTAARAANGDYGALGELAEIQSAVAMSQGPVVAAPGYGAYEGRPHRNHSGAAGPEPVAGWVAPDAPPQPRFSVASQASEHGSVDDFVNNACATGDEAKALAGDLYTSYARWCLENGYLAHSQRKFGLELRARGYERKRRGKGKHWWLGVAAA